MQGAKAVLQRFYEIVNEGATEKLDDVCAPDLKGHAGAGADLTQPSSSSPLPASGKHSPTSVPRSDTPSQR